MQVAEVISKAGGVAAIAARLGLHHTSVIGWRKAGRIPAERVAAVAQIAGLGKHEVRPDLFDAPTSKDGCHCEQ